MMGNLKTVLRICIFSGLILLWNHSAIGSENSKMLFAGDGDAPYGAWIGGWGDSKAKILKDAEGISVIHLDGKALGWGFNNHSRWDAGALPGGSSVVLKYRCLNNSVPENITFSWRMAGGGEKGKSSVAATPSEKFKTVAIPLKKTAGLVMGIVLGTFKSGTYEFTDIKIIPGTGGGAEDRFEKVLFSPHGDAPNGVWVSGFGDSKAEKTKDADGLGIIKLQGKKLIWYFNNHQHLDFGLIPADSVMKLNYRCIGDSKPGKLKLNWFLASGENAGETSVSLKPSAEFQVVKIPLQKLSGVAKGFSLETENGGIYEFADVKLCSAKSEDDGVIHMIKTVEGKVLSNSKPLAGAFVTAKMAAEKVFGWEPVKSTLTKPDGSFSMKIVTAGKKDWQLEIRMAGYQTQEIICDLTGSLKPLTIELKPDLEVVAEIKVDPDKILGEINPLIYGANVAVWHQSDFQSPDYMAAAKESGVRCLRYPGGGKSQELYWQRKEVGNYNSKPIGGSPRNKGVITPKMLTEFVKFCREIGAEPIFTLNNRAEDIDNLVDLVKFAKENKLGIKYYEIGNEPLYYNWPEKERDEIYSKTARLHLDIEKAIRQEDPDIVVMGPAAVNANVYEDLKFFLKPVGANLQIFSVHRYPQDDDREQHYHISDAELLAKPAEWQELGKQLKDLTGEYGRENIPIAITEWNTAWAKPGPRSQDTVGALFGAKNLCEMLKNGITMANYWFFSGNGGYEMYKYKNGQISKFPPFYAFKMLANNFHGKLISADSDQKLLNVYAAKKGNEIVLVVINTSPDTNYQCQINGINNYKFKTGCRLTPTTFDEQIGNLKNFPPYSITVMIKKKSQLQNSGHGKRVPPFLRPLGVEGLACQDRL